MVVVTRFGVYGAKWCGINGVNAVEPIAHVEFTDGITRPVFEDAKGQYVVDDEGFQVRGVWYIPQEECDLPTVVNGHPGRATAMPSNP